MEYGDLDTPDDYLCRITHLRARHLGLLKENEKAWEVEHWQARVKRLSVKNRDVFFTSRECGEPGEFETIKKESR
jgi:hypothetical protein